MRLSGLVGACHRDIVKNLFFLLSKGLKSALFKINLPQNLSFPLSEFGLAFLLLRLYCLL